MLSAWKRTEKELKTRAILRSFYGQRGSPYLIAALLLAGIIAATPFGHNSAPLAITGVQESNGCDPSVTITWTTNQPSTSQIEYGTSATYGSYTALDANLVTSHSQVLTGLAPNTLYHYRARSEDASGNLAASQDFVFYLVQLAWDKNAENYVTGYKIAYGAASRTYIYVKDAGNVTACTAPVLAQGIYYFAVQAYSTGLESSYSNEVHVAVGDVVPLFLFSVQATTLSKDTVTIGWTTDPEADSQVEYGSSTAYGNITDVDLNLVTSHSQTLTGLAVNTDYHFRVKSKDASGNLAISGDFTFRIPDKLPQPYTGHAGASASAAPHNPPRQRRNE